MILRLKKLNGEFDPLFEVSEEAPGEIMEQLRNSMNDTEKCTEIVAEIDGKVIGVMRVNFNRRPYYLPKTEARIMDFYVMPEFRRTGAGKMMIDFLKPEFSTRKVGLISAEFPSLNPIALNFYRKLGFKEIVGIYAKNMEDEGK
jgi:ribosomal protein S18 acetylase RimI-like enzyme